MKWNHYQKVWNHRIHPHHNWSVDFRNQEYLQIHNYIGELFLRCHKKWKYYLNIVYFGTVLQSEIYSEHALVTKPILQLRANRTELRSMDYYHQNFCTFRKCKRIVPPPSLLSNDFEKSCFSSAIFSNDFFSKLTFLNSR